MIRNGFNKVSLLLLLVFFLSKEIFSYDDEKIVALSILSFVLLVYFNIKDSISEDFNKKYSKLHNEFKLLIEEKSSLSFYLRRYWRIFLDLEDLILEIYYWIITQIKRIIEFKNLNRKLFIFYVIKDELKTLIHDQILIKNSIWLLILNNTFFSIKKLLEIHGLFKLNYYFNILSNLNNKTNINNLILNKLNLNINYRINNNPWNCYKTFFSVKNNI